MSVPFFQFSVPQIKYPLGGNSKTYSHVYFLLIVLPRKLATGSIHDYIFCYFPLVGIGLYLFTIFCSRYRQLIIVIPMIISVNVEECDRNNKYLRCVHDLTNLNTKECIRGLPHNAHACAKPETTLQHQFSKIKIKQDDGDVFWWIFGHVSLLKLEKYVEDENH